MEQLAHTLDVDDLVAQLRDDERPTSISPVKFQVALDYQVSDLATLAHVHRNTPRNNPHSPDLQSYMRDALRVIQAAADLRGNVPEALYWFKNVPIRDFDRMTPDMVVSEGRASAVLSYLETLAAGATG